MVKKVLTLVLGLVLAGSAMAQWEQPFNPTVAQSDIQFWTGTGSNRAVIAITWSDSTAGNIGLAWGVQWNGNDVILRDLMDSIATYDSHLTISWNSNHTYINNLSYANADLGLDLVGPLDPVYGYAWFMYGWKDANEGVKQSAGIMADTIASGDFIDWNLMDMETYETLLADTRLMAPAPIVEPIPEDATIAFEDILYWVGEGSNQVVLAVNWADTALAWGYKFSTDSVSVQQVMDDIMEADPRFSWVAGDWGLGDILFVMAAGDTLRGASYYWESKRNGFMDAGMGQMLGNGDFEKWCDPTAGVVVDSMEYSGVWYYTYVYPMEIHPVSVPQTQSIVSVEAVSMSVYPNPVADYVTISGVEGDAVLYDMRGSMVATFRVSGVETRVNLGTLASGVYMLRVGEATAKVVVR